MTPGQPDVAVVRRHLIALDEAVRHLRRHAGRPLAALLTDADERWVVERGLQLCAQNVLDVATQVHGYLGVDVARVHEVLNARLDDFAEFARFVVAYVGESKG
jgi:uncharacterized protein YutE (UPF0331/DUF86 family)